MWNSVLALVAFLSVCIPGDAWRVTLHADPNFKGHAAEVTSEGCSNIPGDINDLSSSISVHGNCVRVYEHGLCQGEMRELFPGSAGHHDLNILNFDNTLSSIGPCPKGFKVDGLLSLVHSGAI
ncbi:unnamed protein product [Bemisia tabaci]|uniref:Beta/gamma crystallin 'Greek key' domain-containing protein n=1 Tax=Bemisia tabaci TaxID=7038 RepID=A0A9P0AAA6_BEMTA|nr:unnamed protein product [Bemisia tabaci]